MVTAAQNDPVATSIFAARNSPDRRIWAYHSFLGLILEKNAGSCVSSRCNPWLGYVRWRRSQTTLTEENKVKKSKSQTQHVEDLPGLVSTEG